MGITIKDAPLVEQLSGDEKIPISDGSNEPKTVNIEQIKEFANKDIEIPTKVSEFENDSDFATSKEVEDAISKIPTPDVSGQIASALVDYVKKVEGKGLSTNDFTNELKTKLEGITPYDPSELEAEISKLETALNTLVGGNASNAIESFNEIISFLKNVSDTESLSGIIAGINARIAEVEGKIPTKVSELDNDKGYLNEHQDISHLATKEELEGKQDLISDLANIRKGAAKGSTAIQEEQYKGTIAAVDTDESVDDPNIPSGSYDDTEIKEQIANLETEVSKKADEADTASKLSELGLEVSVYKYEIGTISNTTGEFKDNSKLCRSERIWIGNIQNVAIGFSNHLMKPRLLSSGNALVYGYKDEKPISLVADVFVGENYISFQKSDKINNVIIVLERKDKSVIKEDILNTCQSYHYEGYYNKISERISHIENFSKSLDINQNALFEYGTINIEGGFGDSYSRIRTLPISVNKIGNVVLFYDIPSNIEFQKFSTGRYSAWAYKGVEVVKFIPNLSIKNGIISFNSDGTFDNIRICLKSVDDTDIDEELLNQCSIYWGVDYIVEQQGKNIKTIESRFKEYSFEYGKVSSLGSLTDSTMQIRTSSIPVEDIGVVMMVYTTPNSLVPRVLSTGNFAAYAYKGENKVKYIPNLSIENGVISFNSDGTFDNIRLCFEKEYLSEISADELYRCKVFPYDYKSEMLVKAATDIENLKNRAGSNTVINTVVPLEYGCYNNVDNSNADRLMRSSDEMDVFFNTTKTPILMDCGGEVSIKSEANAVLFEYDELGNIANCGYVENEKTNKLVGKYITATFIKGEIVTPDLTDGSIDSNGVDYDSTKSKRSGFVSVEDFDFILVKSNESIQFRCYDENYNQMPATGGLPYTYYTNSGLISKVHLTRTFNGVKYIRVILRSIDGVENPDVSFRIVKVDDDVVKSAAFSSNEEIKFVKRFGRHNQTISLIYKTEVSNPRPEEGNNYFSKALLRLPSNYNKHGEPVPLVLFKTGAGGFENINTVEFNYSKYIQYLVDNGFAVFDFHASTSKNPILVDGFGTPTNIYSAMAAYKYVTNHYNVKTDELFLSCKSVGGDITLLLAYSNLPIKAVGMLAPAMNPANLCFGYDEVQQQAYAQDFGFVGDYSSVLTGSRDPLRQEFKDLVEANIDKLAGYQPMQLGVTNIPSKETLVNQDIYDTDKEGSYDNVIRYVPVPIKIWVAPDDMSTPITMHRAFANSAKNGGSKVYIRELPEGTGGHHAVDTDANALQTTNITTRLGVYYETMTTAWVELAQWFISWGG